jgi:hypothetical protein
MKKNAMDEQLPRLPVWKRSLRRTPELASDDKTLTKIFACSRIRCTQKEAAAVLGVAYQTFVNFLARYPEARATWEDGKQYGRASLRRLLGRQAQNDPAQARFLAKDTRWLKMDDGKDRLPDTQITLNNNVLNLTDDDRRRRIEELQRKVLTNAKPRDES